MVHFRFLRPWTKYSLPWATAVTSAKNHVSLERLRKRPFEYAEFMENSLFGIAHGFETNSKGVFRWNVHSGGPNALWCNLIKMGKSVFLVDGGSFLWDYPWNSTNIDSNPSIIFADPLGWLWIKKKHSLSSSTTRNGHSITPALSDWRKTGSLSPWVRAHNFLWMPAPDVPVKFCLMTLLQTLRRCSFWFSSQKTRINSLPRKLIHKMTQYHTGALVDGPITTKVRNFSGDFVRSPRQKCRCSPRSPEWGGLLYRNQIVYISLYLARFCRRKYPYESSCPRKNLLEMIVIDRWTCDHACFALEPDSRTVSELNELLEQSIFDRNHNTPLPNLSSHKSGK